MAEAPSPVVSAAPARASQPSAWRRAGALLPGFVLCLSISAVAFGLEHVETRLAGRAWLEALVLAILIGTVVRSVWTPSERWRAGIAFSAKTVLEVAVVLLGASLSAAAILAAGPALLIGIAVVVAVALGCSYGLGRLLGLSRRMAVLVACGNSICGNSAIVAVAPVIKAEAEDVAASIAFTAALGIIVVLLLPFGQQATGMSPEGFGILSGMTVYAVPQVLAATAPVGLLSMQTGTLVKLIRVMMLAPVIFLIGLLTGRRDVTAPAGGRVEWSKFVPWFIVGFVLLMGLRSASVIPDTMLHPIETAATALTIISMAALGLSVDMRTIMHSGGRVLATGTLSLVVLTAISLTLLHLLGIR